MDDVRRSFAGMLVISLVVACSSGGSAPPDGGAGSGGGGSGGSGALASTCQGIRLCVAQTPCATDACVRDCAAKGTASAQTTYEALRACTARTCAVNDVVCACEEQCNADGNCLAEVDACLGNLAADDICDTLCR